MTLEHLLNNDGIKLELEARLNMGEEFQIISIRSGQMKVETTSTELIKNQLLNTQ